MSSHSKSLDQKQLVKLLMDDGWEFKYQKGSHRMFKHPVKKGKISVPFQCSKNIELQILRQAGVGRYADRAINKQNRVYGMGVT